jgi:hypothetical protein
VGEPSSSMKHIMIVAAANEISAKTTPSVM